MADSSILFPITSSIQIEQWKHEQLRIRQQIIVHDDLDWLKVDASNQCDFSGLTFVGGLDISFEGDTIACACLVVLNYPAGEVVYEDLIITEMTIPYIPGFLAFRELPVLVNLIDNLRKKHKELMPQILFCDGNGMLHARECGVACHLGVVTNIPTIGIAKNIYTFDGITQNFVNNLGKQTLKKKGDFTFLQGNSGKIFGAMYQSTEVLSKPSCFVSIGHRVSLATALQLVRDLNFFKVIEPIRQADLRSRDYLRKRKLKKS